MDFWKPCQSDFGLAPGNTVKSACILIHKRIIKKLSSVFCQYLATWLHGMKNMIGLEFKITRVLIYVRMHLYCEHTHVKQGIKIISDLIQLLPKLNIKQAVLHS